MTYAIILNVRQTKREKERENNNCKINKKEGVVLKSLNSWELLSVIYDIEL